MPKAIDWGEAVLVYSGAVSSGGLSVGLGSGLGVGCGSDDKCDVLLV